MSILIRMCESLTEHIIAEVVSREEKVMYDDPSFIDLKKYTVEELYTKLDDALTTNISSIQPIVLYLSELYRRGVPWPELLDWWEYDVVRCECPVYDCELTALFERVDQFTVNKKMNPDEIRDKSGGCVRCHTGPLLSKEESKEVHEQTIDSQLQEILHYVKIYVNMELVKLRKIKKMQMDSIF